MPAFIPKKCKYEEASSGRPFQLSKNNLNHEEGDLMQSSQSTCLPYSTFHLTSQFKCIKSAVLL